MIKQIVRAALPRRVWTHLRLARIEWEVGNYPTHSVDHVYGGHPFRCWLADLMASPEQLTCNCSLDGQVDDGTDGWGLTTVPSTTVDELTGSYGPPAVLFVDVEGFVLAVLRGARETLEQSKPDCFIEVHRGCGLEKFGGSVEALVGMFPPHYRLLFCEPDRDPTFRPLEAATNCPSKRFYLVALGTR
jgi:hypothetical protein